MSWKAFIVVSVSAFLISFPQNIIGCGPDADPYDYYTSFFHQDLPDAQGYRPFYYSGYTFLFDENEPVEVSDLLANEWAGYCGTPVTDNHAKAFVNKFNGKDVKNLYQHIEKGEPLTIPDSVRRNSMTAYFIKSKDLEALGYVLYAKQVEPHVAGPGDAWEPPVRDSVKMARLIKSGRQLYNAAKSDFFKLKYAYQVIRLALYSGNNNDAIALYDEYLPSNNSKSVLQPLSMALKAGALFRTNRDEEAALLFSKAFNISEAKRISNYLGFKWSVSSRAARNEYLVLCKTNEEKAGMLALFALGSTENELETMEQIYTLNAGSEALEVLAVREINKLEEIYFTPALMKEKGGSSFYFSWEQKINDSTINRAGGEVRRLTEFLSKAAGNKALKNRGLYATGAAYTAYMVKDYANAKKYLATAKEMELNQKVKDQWALINILVTISEKEKIDAAFEEQLLPSFKWLKERAGKEKPLTASWYEVNQWQKIYRDLLTEILAKRYHQQGDYHKEALCVGAAGFREPVAEYDYNYSRGADFMRSTLASKDVEQLYALLTSKQQNKFEQYLIKNNSVTQSLVADFAGTAYLREYNYLNAVQWFKRSNDKKSLAINTNPFADLLYDQEEQLESETTFKTDKLAFAETMMQLEKLAISDKANATKHFYKIATGMYNMTYYGHAWKLVEYYRSGSDGYYIPKDAGRFKKEYYGCFKAHDYFEKAMNASEDKNFKARCLFMMAKCSQKQLPRPQYGDYNQDWNNLEAAEKKYFQKFKYNKYFPQLAKEYSKTAFFEEAVNSCSYLKDFIEKK